MAPSANPKPLAGIGVLVTRPAERAAALAALIEERGGEAIAFPILDITPPADGAALLVQLHQLEGIDLAIFVSAHAARNVGNLLAQHRLQIPPTTRVAAVGPATASQCEQSAIRVDFVPSERIDSEGLLDELRAFDAAGKNILIFRGQSGRETLKEVLEGRGAQVRYVESYRREITTRSFAPVLKRWRAGEIDAVAVTSVAVVDALAEVIGSRDRRLLVETPIFVYSRRVGEYCRGVGVGGEIRVAGGVGDLALVEAVVGWVGG